MALIASGILKVVPGMVDEVLAELELMPKVSAQGVYREEHVVFVAEGFDLEQLRRLRQFLLEELPAIEAATPICGAIEVGSAGRAGSQRRVLET